MQDSIAYWLEVAQQQLDQTGDDYDEQDIFELAEALQQEDGQDG